MGKVLHTQSPRFNVRGLQGCDVKCLCFLTVTEVCPNSMHKVKVLFCAKLEESFSSRSRGQSLARDELGRQQRLRSGASKKAESQKKHKALNGDIDGRYKARKDTQETLNTAL